MYKWDISIWKMDFTEIKQIHCIKAHLDSTLLCISIQQKGDHHVRPAGQNLRTLCWVWDTFLFDFLVNLGLLTTNSWGEHRGTERVSKCSELEGVRTQLILNSLHPDLTWVNIGLERHSILGRSCCFRKKLKNATSLYFSSPTVA